MRRASLECNYYELDPRDPNSEEPFSWHKCGRPGILIDEWAGKPAYRCPDHMPEAIAAAREKAWREKQKGWAKLKMGKMTERNNVGFDGVPGHSTNPNDYGPRYENEIVSKHRKGRQKLTSDGHPIYDVMAVVGDEAAGETTHWLRVGIAFGGQTNDGIKIKVEAVPHRWNGTVFIYPRYE